MPQSERHCDDARFFARTRDRTGRLGQGGSGDAQDPHELHAKNIGQKFQMLAGANPSGRAPGDRASTDSDFRFVRRRAKWSPYARAGISARLAIQAMALLARRKPG